MGSRHPFQVDVEGDRVTAQAYGPEGDRGLPTFVLAHGAGAGQFSPFIARVARGLADGGIQVITFDFPYMERGKRVPDRAPKLESAYRAMVGEVLARHSPGALFIGGKSLGGRIASHLAAAGDELAGKLSGVICLGYPLHPPGAPTRMRDTHLPRIRAPMLVVQGERDTFGSPDEIRAAIRAMDAPVQLFVVEGGDHSLSVAKSSSVTQEEVYRRVVDEIASWMRRTAHLR
jgi:predicted alpha/beta-hydrolase family hydrolase